MWCSKDGRCKDPKTLETGNLRYTSGPIIQSRLEIARARGVTLVVDGKSQMRLKLVEASDEVGACKRSVLKSRVITRAYGRRHKQIDSARAWWQ